MLPLALRETCWKAYILLSSREQVVSSVSFWFEVLKTNATMSLLHVV